MFFVSKGNCHRALAIGRGVWVPAFAGTTGEAPDSNFKQLQLHDLAACFARGLLQRPARRAEGAGNAGRPMRPIAACAIIVVESTRVSQVTPETPSIPRAMVLTVSCALSPATGRSCHRRLR